MIGSVAGGFALSTVDVNGIFLLFSFFPLLQLAACGLIDDKRLTDGALEYERKGCKGDDRQGQTEPIQTLKRITSNDRNDTNEKEPGGFNEVYRDQGVACRKGSFAEESDEEGVCVYSEIASVEAGDEAVLADKRLSVSNHEDWVEIEPKKLKDVSEDCGFNSEEKSKELEVFPLDGIKHFEQFDPLNEIGLRRRKNEAGIAISKKDSEVTKEFEVSFLSKIRRTFTVLFQAIREPTIRRPMVTYSPCLGLPWLGEAL